jgi:hypothetical protein
MDCKSTDTNSLEANLANWLSFSLARSKKRPFVHSAGLGWQTDARRRAVIRSIAVVAAQRVGDQSGAPRQRGVIEMVEGERIAMQPKLK